MQSYWEDTVKGRERVYGRIRERKGKKGALIFIMGRQ